MAGSRTGMTESTVRLLIHDAATVPRPASTGRHHHHFWQLDHCASGVITVLSGGIRRSLPRGRGVLLPPGSPHEFRYPAGCAYVSWKFAWDGPGPGDPVHLDRQPGWRGLAGCLAAGPAAAAVPHLLTAAMRLAGAPEPATGLAAELARLVDAHPDRVWTVAAAAGQLGLSPGHASARCRAVLGMSLKRWLDVRRAAHAGRALAGSDLGLADVAARCGFSDQFAFSRFFRRIAGESPSAFRARRPAGTKSLP